uniref:ARAD1C15554p n=1 Tax=Blastobotrys adeninivorans TaxID=409370 RepID=A0A060T6P8_BLAAD
MPQCAHSQLPLPASRLISEDRHKCGEPIGRKVQLSSIGGYITGPVDPKQRSWSKPTPQPPLSLALVSISCHFWGIFVQVVGKLLSPVLRPWEPVTSADQVRNGHRRAAARLALFIRLNPLESLF